MKTYVQPGNTITLTAPYAVVSGDGLLVGSIFERARARRDATSVAGSVSVASAAAGAASGMASAEPRERARSRLAAALAVASGKRISTRLPLGLAENGIRQDADRLRAE